MGGKPANAWPEERTKKLIHLLEKGKREGNISYHRIAEELGVTRSSVAGRVGRLKQQQMVRPEENQSTPRSPRPSRSKAAMESQLALKMSRNIPAPRPIPPTPMPPPIPQPIPPQPTPKDDGPEPIRIHIVDLGFRHCRWPVTDEPTSDMLYCGLDKAEPFTENSYCPYHKRKSASPTQHRIRLPRYR